MGEKRRTLFTYNRRMGKKPIVSIIIVNYKVEKLLQVCKDSILASKPKTPFEIIVIDNTKNNVGYGAGNNFGAKRAKGEFLFFLNPDTTVFPETIDKLVEFMEKEKNVGLVAPLFLDSKNKPYPLQGSTILTPFVAIMCLSFVQKLFPKNPIYKKYYYFDWDKKSIKEVDVAPGTAFLVRKKLFEDVGGFDERFFLFFEENDFCLRVKKLGFKIYINPEAKLVHLWGESTKSLENTKEIFQKSRRYYFQKHFGKFSAFLVELFCR